MIVTLVHVWVIPEKRYDFIKETIKNHQASIQEAGNLRFDFLEDANDKNKFVLYEAYESEEAAAAHKETEHYKVWRVNVGDMMAKPRAGEKHLIIQPLDKTLW